MGHVSIEVGAGSKSRQKIDQQLLQALKIESE
jgi:hypothetical protein